MLRWLPRPYRRPVGVTLIVIAAAIVLGIVGVFLTGHYPHNQAKSAGHSQASAQVTPGTAGASGSSSPAASPSANPAPPAGSPMPTSANCPTSVPSYVNAQLTKFLLAYDSLTKGETNAQRAAELKPLVPPAVYKTLDTTVAGPAPGTTIVPRIDATTLCGQSPTGQLYITESVVEKLTPAPSTGPYNTDVTDTIWIMHNGVWTMTSFTDIVTVGTGG